MCYSLAALEYMQMRHHTRQSRDFQGVQALFRCGISDMKNDDALAF